MTEAPTPPAVSEAMREAIDLNDLCDRLDRQNTVLEPQACADTMDEALLALVAAVAEIARLTERAERAEGELASLKIHVALNDRPVYSKRQLIARAEAAEADLARLRETYTDEDGTVWSPPTAWAYAAACKALNAKTTALAEAEARGRRQLREELSAKAEEQVAYWRKRQSAEKALEEGLSEDGETYTPIGDQPAWQSGYCNGRMSEADWWRQTLFYLSPDDKLPASSEAATANAALAAFVSAFEGVVTPLSEKQEQAYEEAARYLDEIGARPPCPCPACRDARARATAPAETQKPETGEDDHGEG